MIRRFAKFIYFKLLGWKLVGYFPELDKYVVIVVPHTSWWDFLLGLLARKIIDVDINYIGKKSLFKPPFGWYFRWLGGAPVDRTKSTDMVSAVAQIFNERKEFRLALAPEGTRKKVDRWKTGYYYIARTAGVPIIMVAFDYGKKMIKISEPHYTTGNYEEDFGQYKRFYKGVIGKVAAYT